MRPGGEFDLLVVGGGMAGLTAARAAALKDARVLVSEKGDEMYTSMRERLEMVTSFAEVHAILRDRRFLASAGRPEGREFLGDTLVTIDGHEHLERRRTFMPLFLEGFLQGFEQDVLTVIVTDCLDTHLSPPDEDGWRHADLVPYSKDVTMRMAVRLIGLDGADTEKGSQQLYELLEPLGEGAAIEWSERDHGEVLREGLEAKERYREEFFRPAWERRCELVEAFQRGDLDPQELPTDVLTLLRMDWQKDWDDDLPVRSSILYLAGATGNPARQIVYAIDDLAGWFTQHPEDRSEVGDEAFLRRAINETLRLHIAGSPILVRRATEDVELPTGRSIRAGTDVGLDLTAANRDSEVFGDDADRFDPHRHERLSGPVKHFGIAFGGGPHVCIGRPLVLGRDIGVDIEGLEFLALRELYKRGIEPDPDEQAEFAASGQRHHSRFPVRFRNE